MSPVTGHCSRVDLVMRIPALLFAAALAVLATSTPAAARGPVQVAFSGDYAFGTIVIHTTKRRLYYVLGNGQAIEYRIAVGRPGAQWSGETFVSRKAEWPRWTPTPNMRRKNPRLPKFVKGGPGNPLGARAMYLGWSDLRIHGTNAPSSIGRAASSGCYRMYNADVKDLYERVHVGAPVIVLS